MTCFDLMCFQHSLTDTTNNWAQLIKICSLHQLYFNVNKSHENTNNVSQYFLTSLNVIVAVSPKPTGFYWRHESLRTPHKYIVSFLKKGSATSSLKRTYISFFSWPPWMTRFRILPTVTLCMAIIIINVCWNANILHTTAQLNISFILSMSSSLD